MNLVFTLLASIGLGLFVPKRHAAVLAYLVLDSFLFTFQTLDVLLNWMSAKDGMGGAKAFGPFPSAIPIAYEPSEVFAYGVVNLVIIAVGVGLTIGVNKLATRREAAKNSVSVG